MYQYTKRVKIESNLDSCDIYDANKLCKDINSYDFDINDEYSLHLYLRPMSESIKTLLLNVEIYNERYEEVEPSEIVKSIENFKGILATSITKMINDINSRNIKVVCFNRDSGCYLKDGRLYMEVYNFNTGKFNSMPAHQETTLMLYEIDISDLYDKLIK